MFGLWAHTGLGGYLQDPSHDFNELDGLDSFPPGEKVEDCNYLEDNLFVMNSSSRTCYNLVYCRIKASRRLFGSSACYGQVSCSHLQDNVLVEKEQSSIQQWNPLKGPSADSSASLDSTSTGLEHEVMSTYSHSIRKSKVSYALPSRCFKYDQYPASDFSPLT
jgi:hypothetical protein